MKEDDPEIDTAQTPKRFDGRLGSSVENPQKIRKTFTDSSPNKVRITSGSTNIRNNFCFDILQLLSPSMDVLQ